MAHTKNIGQQPPKVMKRKPRQAPVVSVARTQWFDELVADIRTEQLKHDAGVASPEERSLLELMMSNDLMEKAAAFSNLSERIVLDTLVTDYVKQTKALSPYLKKHLLFYHKGGRLTAWLLTDFEHRSQVAGKLLSIEARIYKKYSGLRFSFEARIIDTEMNVAIPNEADGLNLLV